MKSAEVLPFVLCATVVHSKRSYCATEKSSLKLSLIFLQLNKHVLQYDLQIHSIHTKMKISNKIH